MEKKIVYKNREKRSKAGVKKSSKVERRGYKFQVDLQLHNFLLHTLPFLLKDVQSCVSNGRRQIRLSNKFLFLLVDIFFRFRIFFPFISFLPTLANSIRCIGTARYINSAKWIVINYSNNL